jgi:hypothetical protein
MKLHAGPAEPPGRTPRPLFGQQLVSPLALCDMPFLDRRSNLARRYQAIPWWTDGYTLTGTALLISFAVGLAWVAVVFLFKRAFKALA